MVKSRTDSYRGEERRKSPRIPVCLAVATESDAWMSMCHTRDISESGVFLISQRIPSLSSGFSLQLHLPAKMGLLKSRATVVRIQGDSPRGFGMEWIELSEANRKLLQKLSQRWSQAFPEHQA